MPSLKVMAREAQAKPQSTAVDHSTSRKRILFKSTEKVEGSDLESETESESDSNLGKITSVPVRILDGQKLRPAIAKGGVNGLEDDEDDSGSQNSAILSSKHTEANGKDLKSNNRQSSNESESESESASASASASVSVGSGDESNDQNSDKGSESDSESVDALQPTKLGIAMRRASSHMEENAQAKTNEDRSVSKYNPPDGFSTVSEIKYGKGKANDIFGWPNLAGKQLWYITAPSSVPISAVKQVSLQDVQLGKPALFIHGRHYGFVQEQVEDANLRSVLVPEGHSGTYIAGHKVIDQTLHLQHVVRLYKAAESDSPNENTLSTSANKYVRKQPKGLKMRFRPIGFGHGNTGVIGSSSPSTDAPSTADTDTEGIEDAPSLSRQPVNLHQANTRLLEHTSESSSSQGDTFSSGEEMDSPLPAPDTSLVLADSTSESDSSLEESISGKKTLRSVTSTSSKSASCSSQPKKRKIDTFLGDYNTQNGVAGPSTGKDTPLKSTGLKKVESALLKAALDTNGIKSTSKRRAASPLPSKRTKIPQHLHSESLSSPMNSMKHNLTPILPPRQRSSILPPAQWSRSPDTSGVVKTTGETPEESNVEVISVQSRSKKNKIKNLGHGTPSTHAALSDKAQKREVRRLKKKGVDQLSERQREEPIECTTREIHDKFVNTSSASRNVEDKSYQARSPSKSMVNKELSRDGTTIPTRNMEKASKKIKKSDSTLAFRDQNGERAGSSYETFTSIPQHGGSH